ncbi:MAG: hypothetical protein LBP43_07120 [Treponema sp.]|jgi:hypothetical protein|nr:hypothetical protein [Treponema sp.]
MKKVVLLGIFLSCLIPLFADDARTLPARSARFEVFSSFSFANAYFSIQREYTRLQQAEGKFQALNLGFSAAYGITGWLNAAVRWIPGWNVWSKTDLIFEPTRTVTLAGVYDLLTEVKFQIIGERGLVKKNRVRLTVAPQIKIPLPGPNYKEQEKRIQRGEPIVMENLDHHVFGIGGTVSFDLIINKMFFINLYGDGMFYPIPGRVSDAGLYEYFYSTSPGIRDLRAWYRGDLRFEAEPHFEMFLTPKTVLNIGLPLNYTLNCGIQYYATMPNRPVEYQLSLGPNITFLFIHPPLPFAFRISYSLPLWGRDQNATHSITFLAKLFITGK